MSPCKTTRPTTATWSVVHPHAAAIDVHSDNHVVCVGPGQVQTFGAYTADLHALAAHLTGHGVTSVVLESTGVYWIPLFELLEDYGFAVFLIEPSPARHGGARPQTDVLDCQGLQRLHPFGLLRPSFRPPASVLALRGYGRQRQLLVRSAARHVPHVPKAREQMHVKLTEVAADITGVTGSSLITAILAGARGPQALAALRNAKCQKSQQEYAQALEGTWRPEHLFALKQAGELYQFPQRQLSAGDQQLQAELTTLPDRTGDQPFTPRPRQRGRQRNDVRFAATPPLFQALGVDLTLIDGIDVTTALVVRAEIGVEVSQFPTAKHCASWLRWCPNLDQSNRTVKQRPPRQGTNRLAQALRMAAQSVSRTKTTRAVCYHRIKSRLGGRGAIPATAHQLAVLVYRLLKHGVEYVRQSREEYEAKVREQTERSLKRKAAQLGYDLVPKAAAGT